MVIEALLPLNNWVYSNPLITWIFFIAIYCVIGFFLKYVDAACDDKLFNKNRAIIIAIILAVLGALAMALSPTTTIIFTAFILGLIIARKVDTLAFVIGVFICYAIFFILGGTIDPILSGTQVFLILFLATLIEDRVDYKKEKLFKTKKGKAYSFLFEYGFMLKLAAILAFIVLTYEPLFCIAVILFDFSYDVMLFMVHKKLGKGVLWA